MPIIMISGKEIFPRITAALLHRIDVLQDHELSAFRDFLSSAYFNKDERLGLLFERFYQARKEGSNHLKGRHLLRVLFGEEEPPEKGIDKLGKLIKGLHAQLEHFFALQEIQRPDNPLRHRALVLGLKRRRDTALFREASESFRDYLRSQPLTLMRAADGWWLEHHNYFHQNTAQRQPDEPHFLAACRNFDEFSRLTRLRYFCEYINRRNQVSDQFDARWLEEAIAHDLLRESEAPVIRLYILLVRLIQNPANEAVYSELKRLFLEYLPQLAPADKLVLIKMAVNIWLYHYEMGRPGAGEEYFHWTKLGVQENIYLFEGTIADEEYLNVALSAATVRDFPFQMEFMEAYRPYLEPAFQEKAFQLALAYYYFHQNKFPETAAIVNEHFGKYTHDDIGYVLRAKTLLVRCHLVRFVDRLEEGDAFDTEIEALRRFLSQKSLMQEKRRQPYYHFVSRCKAIYSYKKRTLHASKQQLSKQKAALLDSLDEPQPIACRQWLREFIRRL